MNEWSVGEDKFIELHIIGSGKLVAINVSEIRAFGPMPEGSGTWIDTSGGECSYQVSENYESVKLLMM